MAPGPTIRAIAPKTQTGNAVTRRDREGARQELITLLVGPAIECPPGLRFLQQHANTPKDRGRAEWNALPPASALNLQMGPFQVMTDIDPAHCSFGKARNTKTSFLDEPIKAATAPNFAGTMVIDYSNGSLPPFRNINIDQE